MGLMQRIGATLVVLTCAGTVGLAGQHPQVRQGFWIGFGFGGGSAKFDCDSCGPTDAVNGITGFLKLGGTVSNHVLIGGETTGWSKEESGVTTGAANVSATLYYYPSTTAGLFLRGGVGFAAYSVDGGSGNKLTGSGLGLTVGLGYDFRVARNFSLTPVINFSGGALGELQFNGNPSGITGASVSVAQLALGFTWH